MKPIKAWGGFCDGKIHNWNSDGSLAIYKTRKAADADYDDIRPVWIVFEEPKDDGDD